MLQFSYLLTGESYIFRYLFSEIIFQAYAAAALNFVLIPMPQVSEMMRHSVFEKETAAFDFQRSAGVSSRADSAYPFVPLP